LDCQFLAERAEVCGFFNMGTGEQPSAGRGSEYWRVWAMAKGDQPRRGRLSKSVFKGRIFRVRIGDTELRVVADGGHRENVLPPVTDEAVLISDTTALS
jgi:hypothetical protein